MKNTLLIAFSMMLCISNNAQEIGPVILKENGYGLKKLSEAPKRIYIANFKVNYQILYREQETNQGGRTMGGGLRGDTKVELSVGLNGLREEDLLQCTNNIYEKFIARLKSEGFEIVGADEAAGSKEYEGWERMKGGKATRAQLDGYVTVSPSGYEYYVRKVKEDGKEKGTFMDNSPKISKSLGSILVCKVNITVPFCREAESQGSKALYKIGGGSKVVAETDLKISSELVSDGAFSSDPFVLGITVASIAMGKGFDNAIGNWILKDEISIDGVIEKKKYKEAVTADHDLFGTDMYMFTLFSADNRFLKKTHSVPVNPAVYTSAVEKAATNYLEAYLNEFLPKTK
jgi:hypothetical protein